jgi:hypothetical protein
VIRSRTFASTITDPKGDQVWNKKSDFYTAKLDWESPLLVEVDVILSEQGNQRVFVHFLVQPVADLIQDLECKSYDLFRLGFQQ